MVFAPHTLTFGALQVSLLRIGPVLPHGGAAMGLQQQQQQQIQPKSRT